MLNVAVTGSVRVAHCVKSNMMRYSRQNFKDNVFYIIETVKVLFVQSVECGVQVTLHKLSHIPHLML